MDKTTDLLDVTDKLYCVKLFRVLFSKEFSLRKVIEERQFQFIDRC